MRGGTKLLGELGEGPWDKNVRAATPGTRLDPAVISIKTRVKECTTNELGTGVVCSDSQIKVINADVDVVRNSSGDKEINKLCPYLKNTTLIHDPHCVSAHQKDKTALSRTGSEGYTSPSEPGETQELITESESQRRKDRAEKGGEVVSLSNPWAQSDPDY